MGVRSAVAGGVAAVLLLSGCGPAAAPDPEPSASAPPEPAELVLPDDAVLGVVGVATAPNGATADVAVVVHASLPHLVPEAAEAVAATVERCAGEVDASVIAGRGFTFTRVDVSLTPRRGEWPADVALAVLPAPNPEFGSTLVADAGLRQVDASDDDSFPGSVPPCRQPAVLDGAGGGSVFLGIPGDITGANDAASFTAWAFHDFGLASRLPGGLGDAGVSFEACAARITPLGEEFGAPSEPWRVVADGSGCLAGGAVNLS